jgi:hypothetical protein
MGRTGSCELAVEGPRVHNKAACSRAPQMTERCVDPSHSSPRGPRAECSSRSRSVLRLRDGCSQALSPSGGCDVCSNASISVSGRVT